MRVNKIFISVFLLLSSLGLTRGMAQLPDNVIRKFSERFPTVISTTEMEKGLLVSYKKFKKGTIESASGVEKASLMTTMLLGSVTQLYESLRKEDDFEVVVHKSNGFTSTVFLIEFKLKSGSIFILRKMVSGNFSLNPLAAENPQNYSLLFGFDFQSKEQISEFIEILKPYWLTKRVEYTIHKNT